MWKSFVCIIIVIKQSIATPSSVQLCWINSLLVVVGHVVIRITSSPTQLRHHHATWPPPSWWRHLPRYTTVHD